VSILAAVLLVGGTIFLVAGTVGYLRLPDFFCRMHAIGKSETLGTLLTLLGIGCLAGPTLLGLKFALIAVFFFIANPTATHAIARAGLLAGVEPWSRRSPLQ